MKQLLSLKDINQNNRRWCFRKEQTNTDPHAHIQICYGTYGVFPFCKKLAQQARHDVW